MREILSYPAESTADFLLRCCGEMCALVEQIVDANGSLPIDDDAPEAPEPRPGYRRYHTLFSIMLALMAVLIAFGVYYFTQHDYSLKDWAHTYLPPEIQSMLHLDGAVAANGTQTTAGAAAEKTHAQAAETAARKETTTKKKAEEMTVTRGANPTASPTVPAEYRQTLPPEETEAEEEESAEEEAQTDAPEENETPAEENGDAENGED